MSTITPTITPNPGGQRNCVLVVWAALANGDDGAPVSYPQFSDGSVQIEGTFGSGTATMQCSNDGSNYQSMTDPQGNAIAKTSAALEQLTEIARYIRPIVSGGTAGAVTVTALLRRAS